LKAEIRAICEICGSVLSALQNQHDPNGDHVHNAERDHQAPA
jgi:hypothetical protein